MNNPLNLSRRDEDDAISIARYKKLEGHPAWLYTVELFVQTNTDKRTHIASFNCATEREFSQAVEWCDYVIRGE